MVAMLQKSESPIRVLLGTQEGRQDRGAARGGSDRNLRVAFEQGAYETICAGDGRDVVRIVEHGQIDLVVLDMELGPMGGLRTLRILRDIDHWLPVILTSRAWTRHLLSEALHFEASSVLKAPVDLDVLLETVRKLLTER